VDLHQPVNQDATHLLIDLDLLQREEEFKHWLSAAGWPIGPQPVRSCWSADESPTWLFM
jgi:hypothetical protein